jgi:hypothetical protein
MFTTKISTLLVSTVAVGAVSLPAAASAAALVPRPGTPTQLRTGRPRPPCRSMKRAVRASRDTPTKSAKAC